MSDSTGAVQDGAAQTVDKGRFDGLMSAYQREKARADALERQYGGSAGAQDPGDDSFDPGDSQQTDQPEYEDGAAYTYEGGQFVPYQPPTPLRHGGRDATAGTREKTIEQLEADLDAQVGKPSRSGWGDITAR